MSRRFSSLSHPLPILAARRLLTVRFGSFRSSPPSRCIVEDGSLNIFMEFAERGELYTLIQKRKSQYKLFTEDEIMNFFVQIALAVRHIHDKSVLHRDLKSKNIFVNKQGLLKVGDFGIAKVLSSSSDVAKTAIVTPYYLSPEICEDKPYNQKSDVWAMGCILYELTTLNHAFDGQSLPALVLKILSGKYPAISNRYSPKLKRLIDSMFRRNPLSRPSVKQMLAQPYVKAHADKFINKLNRQERKENQEGNPKPNQAAPPKTGLGSEADQKAAPAPATAAKRDKKTWFQEQEAALRELGQALNFQRPSSDADPDPPAPSLAPKPTKTRAAQPRRPMPVFRAPTTGHGGPRGSTHFAPRSNAPQRNPVEEKWSKKRWLREQKEKDEKLRLKAEAEAKKAAKSEALHAEIKANREAKMRKEQEIKKQMARHKSEMKRVKPRLSKADLKAAGAAFAQRQKGQLLDPSSQANGCAKVLEKVPAHQETLGAVGGAPSAGEDGGARREKEGKKSAKNFPVVEIFVPNETRRGERERNQHLAEVEALPEAVPKALPAGDVDDRTFIVRPEASTGGHFERPSAAPEAKAPPSPSPSGGASGDSGKHLALRVGIGQRIESLRVTLENKIGEEKFIAVYKYLRRIGQTDVDPEVETQAKLETILGNSNIQYAFLIHKLLMLEESLY